MIKLIDSLPDFEINSVELFKLYSLFAAYPKETLLWRQDGTDTLIASLDGNMIISTKSVDDELRQFLNIISPASVFSRFEVIGKLLDPPYEIAEALCFNGDIDEPPINGDLLKSDEIYRLLDVKGLKLPPYEYFAPDFCHRLNHGLLNYFAIKNKCAAVSLSLESTALINGIASHQKGCGSLALKELLKRERGKLIFACAAPEAKEFYIKNGFTQIYKAAYWNKKEVKIQ